MFLLFFYCFFIVHANTNKHSYVHSKSKCNKQPRFSWSLIYEKHRRFAPRLGRVAPKSDTSNAKKGAPFLWAPQD